LDNNSIMKSTKLLTLICIVFLTACNHVYKRYDKESFPTYSWKSSDGIIFKPKIEDISKSYSLIFGIRHLYGFQFESIKVTLRTITPSGKETEKQYEIKVKNPQGDYIARCGGDLCDLETVIDSQVKFDEPGEYTYFVTHNLPVESVPGVMEVGLIIDESE
jgi:gliding motility-associated lipoprotein GldH